MLNYEIYVRDTLRKVNIGMRTRVVCVYVYTKGVFDLQKFQKSRKFLNSTFPFYLSRHNVDIEIMLCI